MSLFSEDDLVLLKEEFALLSPKRISIAQKIASIALHTEKGEELSQHGFLRRFFLLFRSIENIFELIPPESTEIPPRETILDVTINVQSTIINSYGCIDNLAWVWVHEKAIKCKSGKDLPISWVGFRKKNKFIRDTLPVQFVNTLQKFDAWFENLENFRHSLAHQVPLYIAPYAIYEKDKEKWQDYWKDRQEASIFGDSQKISQIENEISESKIFYPIYSHSFCEKSKHIPFHAQSIADFNTIHQLAMEFYDYLG